MPLRVGVVGAGIGGLCAAIAMRRIGAQVHVFEKSDLKNEIGAAMTIPPNGLRILESWGFDPAEARGVEAKQIRMVELQTLNPIIVDSFKGDFEEFGSRFMFFHRVDLHTLLKHMAESSEGDGVPVKMHSCEAIISINCDQGVVRSEKGNDYENDLVIIADGIGSRFVRNIDDTAQPLEDVGHSFYRCLIPMKDVLQDSELASIWQGQDPGFWVPLDHSTGYVFVTYPCRDGTMLNVAVRHDNVKNLENTPGGWNNATSISDIIKLTEHYHPALKRLLSKTTNASVYKIFRREPLSTFAKGRAVIIGDAAHPVAPTHAQAANLAMEEAAALQVFLSKLNSSQEIPRSLEQYSKMITRRIHTTQLLSDAMPGEESELRRRGEEAWGNDDIFPYTAMNFTKPIRHFFYTYDVRKEAEIFQGHKLDVLQV